MTTKNKLVSVMVSCLAVFFVNACPIGALTYAASATATTAKNAQFVSQVVPATMTAGQTYPVTVVMKNTGTTSWTAANKFKLGSQNPQDNAIWGVAAGRVLLATGDTIAKDQSKTFTFNVKAPATPGTYNLQWQMVQEGASWFGAKTTNVAVKVVAAVTITGKVTKTSVTGAVIAGVKIGLCNSNGEATTDSNGVWSKVVASGTEFCARITSGLPAGWSSIKAISNNSCHANVSTYETQVAGKNAFTGCSATGDGSWDLNQDNGLNFVVSCSPKTCVAQEFNCGAATDGCGVTLACGTCAEGKNCVANKCVLCTPAAVSGCRVCKTDGSAWVDTDSKCTTSGHQCINGACVSAACDPESVSGCKVCKADGTGWADTDSKCTSGKVCSSGVCVDPVNGKPVITVTDIKEVYSGKETTFSPTVSDPEDDNLSYFWTCTGGNLSSNTVRNPTYVAPVVSQDKDYVCTLKVSDGHDNSVSKDIKVVVKIKTGEVVIKPNQMTKDEIRAAIAAILNMIASLNEQLKAMGSVTTTSPYSCSKITKLLKFGMAGDPEVKCMQEFLAAQGFVVTASGNFDGNTRVAVIQFQEKYAGEILIPYGLKFGSGNVGLNTQKKINQIIASVSI